MVIPTRSRHATRRIQHRRGDGGHFLQPLAAADHRQHGARRALQRDQRARPCAPVPSGATSPTRATVRTGWGLSRAEQAASCLALARAKKAALSAALVAQPLQRRNDVVLEAQPAPEPLAEHEELRAERIAASRQALDEALPLQRAEQARSAVVRCSPARRAISTSGSGPSPSSKASSSASARSTARTLPSGSAASRGARGAAQAPRCWSSVFLTRLV
jgi:hypothetical protein